MTDWKSTGMARTVLWAEDGPFPTILVARAGEDHEKLIGQFRKDLEGSNLETTFVGVLTCYGLPPRPEYQTPLVQAARNKRPRAA